jgi:hypothetical protein
MKQDLPIGTVTLDWCEWTAWPEVREASIPWEPGVYEVRHLNHPNSERLYIGMAKALQRRVYRGMIRNSHHAAGTIPQDHESTQVLVRWAVTPRPAAAEEELIRAYIEQFGQLPQYARR